MNIFAMFMIFFLSILIHELGHIIFVLFFSKELPHIRFRKFSIMIIPTKLLSINEKKWFLGGPIMLGMFFIVPFFFYYPTASWLAMVAYLISCGMDFYNLMKLEVKKDE